MIKSVKIQNVQSHELTELEFSSGVNVIKGTSDSGKSAFIRSLKFVLQNRPGGNWAHPHFADDKALTSVALEFDNGAIKRQKNKKENCYIVNNKEKFEALRSDIPDKVQLLTNMTDINFQSQFDKYFLLQDSPGEVGRKLNTVVGLDVIDSTIKFINGVVSKETIAIERNTEERDSIQQKLEGFKFLAKVDDKIKTITNLFFDKEIKEALLAKLEPLPKLIHQFENEIKAKKEWLTVEKKFKKMNQVITVAKNLTEKINILNELAEKVRYIHAKTETMKRFLISEHYYIPLKEKIKQRSEIDLKLKAISYLHQTATNESERLRQGKEELEKGKELYISKFKLIKQCPFCGSKVNLTKEKMNEFIAKW